MVICTSITKDYLEKSKPFFESVSKYFWGKKICFCIGFTVAEIKGWEIITVNEVECKWQPRNRPDYASLQHGEFIKHYNFSNDEMIIFVDSDMILQKRMDLKFPVTDSVLVTRCSYPAKRLFQVVADLKCKKRADKFFNKYKTVAQMEFCAAFLMARASTWQKIYRHSSELYDMLKCFDHHAAWQLLINAAISNNLHVKILPDFICNADWYEGTKAVNDKGVLKIGKEPVYFNHTKFSQDYKY